MVSCIDNQNHPLITNSITLTNLMLYLTNTRLIFLVAFFVIVKSHYIPLCIYTWVSPGLD